MKRIPAENREFVCYWRFTGWAIIQLGFHIDFLMKNVEIHIPFGFFRIGLESRYEFYGK